VTTHTKPKAALAGIAGARSVRDHHNKLDLLVRSLERVASASVDEGPLPVCCEVVREVSEHTGARWVVVALRPDAFPDTAVRLLGRDPRGRFVTDVRSLPPHIRSAVRRAWASPSTVLGPREMYAPLQVGGRSEAVLVAVQDDIDGTVLEMEHLDLRGLTILASQAVVSLHYDDVRQRLVATERRKLASELHETVARQILSAGVAVECCRSEVAVGTALHEQLGRASRLTRAAVHQLRASIHVFGSASHHKQDLPTALHRLAKRPLTQPLEVTVQVCGEATAVPSAVTSGVLRIASECLFNAIRHGRARRAVLALSYREGDLLLVVGDDGDGDPAVVRRFAHDHASGLDGGYRRGLADIVAIAEALDGEFRVDRSDLGGIRIQVRLPICADERSESDRHDG
jgi:signal transduction histidine kinase